MEKDRVKKNVLGWQGQQGRPEIGSVCMSTVTSVVWSLYVSGWEAAGAPHA